jgi:hypothetical protein
MIFLKLISNSVIVLLVLLISACEQGNGSIAVDGFSIKVIDRVTQKPIEDALVIASFVARGGSHSSTIGLSNGLEALTGKDGMAHFPAWSTNGIGFGGNDPVIVAYKTSYTSDHSSTKSVRKRNGSIFHVTNISMLSLTALPLMKCEDTKFESTEECDSEAYGDMMLYIGPTKKDLTKLPKLSKVIEINR